MSILTVVNQFDHKLFGWIHRSEPRRLWLFTNQAWSFSGDGYLYPICALLLWQTHGAEKLLVALGVAFLIERILYLLLKNFFRSFLIR